MLVIPFRIVLAHVNIIILFLFTALDRSSSSLDSLGRCLSTPFHSPDGQFILYDTVLNLKSGKLFFIGPLEKLWIVPETPEALRSVISWSQNFGEGLNWTEQFCLFARSAFINFRHDILRQEEIQTCPGFLESKQLHHFASFKQIQMKSHQDQNMLSRHLLKLPIR
jgi:hypothetical protein